MVVRSVTSRLVTVCGALLAAGAGFPIVAASTPTAAAAPSVRTMSTHKLLDELTVSATYHSGYSRSKFSLWSKHPDGCNTRYQVLIRDAVRKPIVAAGCYLAHGKWVSPYDGFTTTNPTKMEIDHVVPLAVAWGSGAWRWNAKTRKAFGNDLGTSYDLIAVSVRANDDKGDSGPDDWLPPRKSFDCRYMADYTAVLWRWRLHIEPTQESFVFKQKKACGWPTVKEPPRPAIH
jgi:hypothetical protein